MHEHVLHVADRVEDVALGQEVDRLRGRVRLIAKLWDIEQRDLHQVALAEHALGFEHVDHLVEAELGGEPAAQRRLHGLVDLEAHDRRELAIAQLDLDHLEQIVGLFFVALGDRVARDAEHRARLDLHAREQEVEVVRHHVGEIDERARRPEPHEPRRAPPPIGTLTRASSDSLSFV